MSEDLEINGKAHGEHIEELYATTNELRQQVTQVVTEFRAFAGTTERAIDRMTSAISEVQKGQAKLRDEFSVSRGITNATLIGWIGVFLSFIVIMIGGFAAYTQLVVKPVAEMTIAERIDRKEDTEAVIAIINETEKDLEAFVDDEAGTRKAVDNKLWAMLINQQNQIDVIKENDRNDLVRENSRLHKDVRDLIFNAQDHAGGAKP